MDNDNVKQINVISKEILARLLAQENLLIEHKNVSTAMFNVKNRTLILPIYKDVTVDMYDLFIGHECAHALYTPMSSIDVLMSKKVNKEYKFCINVVEDLRIEKIIKKKFPGLGKSFYNGYKDLLKKNFFGINGKDLNQYSFADRLNLYFKVGSLGEVFVPFNEEEQKLVEEADRIETFEQAVEFADKLYEKFKKDQEEEENNGKGKKKKTKRQKVKNGTSSSSGRGFEDQEDFEDSESDEDESEGSDGNEGDDEEYEEDEESETESSSGKDEGNEENKEGSKGDKPSFGETYENEEKNKKKFVDESKKNEITYINIPEENRIDLTKVIVPYQELHDKIAQHYNTVNTDYYSHVNENQLEEARIKFNESKNQNSPIISYLVKEFELKKAADKFKRTTVSKTGIIDMNKVHKFKYHEDLFLRKSVVSQGKNHGLIMFIDCSSSMHECFADTIEQLMNLVFFCKKVNIPFEVYGFGTTAYGRRGKAFGYTDSYMHLEDFVLKNYFSSKMSFSEFNKACTNMQAIMNYYNGTSRGCTLPRDETLNYTPLNSTIVCAVPIIKKFKQAYNLQKVNAVFLTDGASDPISMSGSRYGCYGSNIIFRDKISRREYRGVMDGNGFCATAKLYDYLKDRTGANVIGFYLTTKQYARSFMDEVLSYHPKSISCKVDESYTNFKKDGNIVFKNAYGYTELYMLEIKSLEISEKEFIIKGDETNRNLAKKFSSCFQGRIKNRIILSKFIEQIA